MNNENWRGLAQNLVLPTLLFVAVGAMVWAVRGCSGFGAVAGCTFAGVTWGAAWWYISRDPSGRQSRPYTSGWIILALTVGIGLSGARGWMQWPAFFEGHLQLNYEKGEFVPISRAYGFLWLFIAGVPWAGIGACVLAWCGSRPARAWEWGVRIACGVGVAILAVQLYKALPNLFLPLYGSLKAQYTDAINAVSRGDTAYPNLKRLYGDNNSAMLHLGVYLGLLLAEVIRRDWRNVRLILTVGLVNGIGWALFQNWKWAGALWPDAKFNFWRCWETSGGISIGVAYGLAYFTANRPLSERQRALRDSRSAERRINLEWLITYVLLTLVGGGVAGALFPRPVQIVGILVLLAFGIAYYLTNRNAPAASLPDTPSDGDPNVQRLGLYLGLLVGLGLSIRNGLKGWANIYLGREDYWSGVLWSVIGPLVLIGVVAIVGWVWVRRRPRDFQGDVFPHAYAIVWLVIIVQNIIAQLITGPGGLGRLLFAGVRTVSPDASVMTPAQLVSTWQEQIFNVYYVMLFLISAIILYHYHVMKRLSRTA